MNYTVLGNNPDGSVSVRMFVSATEIYDQSFNPEPVTFEQALDLLVQARMTELATAPPAINDPTTNTVVGVDPNEIPVLGA